MKVQAHYVRPESRRRHKEDRPVRFIVTSGSQLMTLVEARALHAQLSRVINEAAREEVENERTC